MARETPSILRLRDLAPGQTADFFALLVERSKGSTRENKPYYLCRFRDARRTATSMIWADSQWFDPCETQWTVGQFFKLRALYGEHEKYGPQIEIQKIREVNETDPAAGFDPAELVDRSRFDSAKMFAELRGLAHSEIRDEPLQRLVLTLLDRQAEKFQRVPASQGKYFPFASGLLEHTLSVTKSCLLLAVRYSSYYEELKPPLNRDLLIAGAVLHEIGRVVEFDDVLGMQVSVAGRMFGHLFLGRDLVREAAREQGDVNPELLQLLEHLIVSHLALPEWGSPRLPLIPEALILHHAKDLDAKLEMYARCLSRDQSPGPFTDRDPVLGKQLLKGRSV